MRTQHRRWKGAASLLVWFVSMGTSFSDELRVLIQLSAGACPGICTTVDPGPPGSVCRLQFFICLLP